MALREPVPTHSRESPPTVMLPPAKQFVVEQSMPSASENVSARSIGLELMMVGTHASSIHVETMKVKIEITSSVTCYGHMQGGQGGSMGGLHVGGSPGLSSARGCCEMRPACT